MKIRIISSSMIVSVLLSVMTFAQLDFGGDIVSRYVWRGTDFGNAVSVQPYLSVAIGGLEMGAWASYPVCATVGANENDLYISYVFGNFGVMINDYYFPEGLDLFNFADDGAHILEGMLSVEFGAISVMGAMNFRGDTDNSMYAEAGYGICEKDDISVSAFAGLGNGLYVTDGGFNFVNLGISASKGAFSIAFIVNPEAETDFLVLGYNLSF